MTKGERTKAEIIEAVTVLFNECGYAATTMQDVTRATGLQRGGIYNHFESKEQLEAESFAFASERVGHVLRAYVDEAVDPVVRLKRIGRGFYTLYENNALFPSGCPVLNTAVEAKRHMPALRGMAREAMTRLQNLIESAVREAVREGSLKADVAPHSAAAIFIATLEGAMVLSVLYDDMSYLEQAARHLDWYVDQLRAVGSEREVRHGSGESG